MSEPHDDLFELGDVSRKQARENWRTWFWEIKKRVFLMRSAGYDEETIYERILALSEEAGEPADMVMEILYSDSLLPLGRTIEDERNDMIDRLNSLIDALKPKVRLGDAEAIQLTKEIQEDIDELRRNAP